MPRAARIYYPGGIFHLISRFFEKRFMLDSDEDRLRYLSLLGRTVNGTDHSLLAYCLMSSHVHLVVRAGQMPLQRLMSPVNTGFALWKNRQLGGRKGPVFAERFKSVLVEEDSYLLELVRYVHNNPVRAGVAGAAAQSDWSSHRAYVGSRPAPKWLNRGYVLGVVDGAPMRAAGMFGEFVDEGRGEERRPELVGESHKRAAKIVMGAVGDGWRLSDSMVGCEAFLARVQEDIREIDQPLVNGVLVNGDSSGSAVERPVFDDVVSAVCAHFKLERLEFEDRPKSSLGIVARRMIVLLWVQRYGGTQAEVARGLKVLSSKVSRWYAAAVKSRMHLDPAVDAVEQSLRGEQPAFSRDFDEKVSYNLKTAQETK